MRTTVTLDPDVKALVDRSMRERGVGFKEALNDAVRSGLAAAAASRRHVTPTYDLGVRPGVDLDKALTLAGELDDAEIVRELAQGK